MKTIGERLTTFINKNPALVDKYNNLECLPTPLEESVSTIEDGMLEMRKINKFSNFNSILKSALHIAVCENVPIDESFNIMKVAPGDWNPENSIQQYFKEINHIYTKNNNDFDIEYIPENRDKLISMNLKNVISIAKGFQGMGLPLQDLISAGNVGLVLSWDKYDPRKSTLHDDVYKIVNNLPDIFTYNELKTSISQFLIYGSLKNKFEIKFNNPGTFKKEDVLDWIDHNIRNAKFSSVASMWIRAYIMIELDNNSRIVKKPKSVIRIEKEDGYQKEFIVNLDSPAKPDSDITIGDMMSEVETTDLDVDESYYMFKAALKKLMTGVKTRDRAIFLKKFGIGLPRPMTPKEISDQEGISIARISQILQETINIMKINAQKYEIDGNELFEHVRNMS